MFTVVASSHGRHHFLLFGGFSFSCSVVLLWPKFIAVTQRSVLPSLIWVLVDVRLCWCAMLMLCRGDSCSLPSDDGLDELLGVLLFPVALLLLLFFFGLISRINLSHPLLPLFFIPISVFFFFVVVVVLELWASMSCFEIANQDIEMTWQLCFLVFL